MFLNLDDIKEVSMRYIPLLLLKGLVARLWLEIKCVKVNYLN